MSTRRTERLLNLVICLLATRRWLTKEQIRAAVPQYADCESTEAFDRMFERDKENLRELGIPVVTGRASAWFEDEIGYRIDRESYALPEIDFTAEEMAVLGLASRVWQQASLAGPAARALVKLRALGVDTEDGSLVGVEPRVRTTEPAFQPLYAATRDRAEVSFTYRKPSGEVGERHLQPWALTSRSGRWYVVGFDLDRGASRAFRLSRVDGEVRRNGPPGGYAIPEHVDPAAMVGGTDDPDDARIAVLRVREERCAGLRLRAVPPEEMAEAVPAGPEVPPGWDVIGVRVREVGALAQELAGYGADVLVLTPPDLRESVIRRLRGALQAVEAGLK
jgi:proteasome accessory factor B